ncbi:alpha/beta fold hydrolase [Streptomyces sp. NPDC001380]|uniref:alpha/beta fold hydrolase n=1 Tax=Streptomyces sp. NPDC001380 TaxID=3364566 RepID=UPI0036D168E3
MSRPRLPRDCVPPDPRRELRVRSADGTWLHAEVHGPEDAPTVVLAHGWTCSTAFWAPVLHRLAADHRLVAYDQRGHGRSDAPASPAGYGTGALADDLEAVVEATVAHGSRAVLAGHSMGGMTVMAAADRSAVRDRTAAVLLASTGSGSLLAELRVLPFAGRAPRARLAAHRALLASRLPLGPVTGLSRAVLKYAVMGPAAPADRVEACARIVHACPRRVRAAWAQVLGTLDLHAEAGRLAAPTAVLVGAADRLTPPVLAHRLHAVLPRPERLTELPGTGHMSPVERPDAVADEIRRLVADHLHRPAAPQGTAAPQDTAAPQAPAEQPAPAAAPHQQRSATA